MPTGKLANGYYSVQEDPAYGMVAQVGDNYYETLAAAIAAAEGGATVTLLTDIDLANETPVLLENAYNTYFKVENKSITIDLNGKTISGTYSATDTMLVGVFSTENDGHLVLTGNGTVNVTATGNVYSLIANYEEGCSITIVNGTYTLDKASDSLVYSGCSANEGKTGVVVNGGTFTLGNVGTGSNGKPWIFNCLSSNSRHAWVTGGTFNADVNHQYWIHEVQLPETKALKDNGDGTWTVVDAAAYVVEIHKGYKHYVGYATLQEAADAAAAKGWEVVVLNSETVSNADDLYWALEDGKVAVVDGKLEYDDMIVAGGKGTEVTVFLNKGAELSKDCEGRPTFYAADGGILNVAGNGTVITDNPKDYTVFAAGSGTAVINGGNFVMGDTTNKGQLYSQNSGTIVINDGTFISTDSNSPIVYCINGFVEINGGFFQNTANPKQALLSMGNNLNYINNQKITLRGGTFVNWNPMTSSFARPWTNPDVPALIVLADGYTIISEERENGDIWYTVVPMNK